MTTSVSRSHARRAILLGGLLLSLAAPAAASAASTVNYFGGARVSFAAEAGDVNVLTVSSGPGTVTFNDTADVITETAAQCVGTGTNTVTCTDPSIEEWFASLGNLADKVTATGFMSGEAEGGDGPDQMIGGPGPDNFNGEGDHDLITGNGGDDRAAGFGGGVNSDQITLGEGNDVVVGINQGTVADLGPGSDMLAYVPAGIGTGVAQGGPGVDQIQGIPEGPGGGGLTINLAGETIQGKNPGIPVTTARSFENVGGTGEGRDTITGTAGPNFLRTGPDPFFNLIAGPQGLGNGNDVVNPLAGSDIVDTGDGNDAIATVDGFQDSISCGGGADTVTADQFDQVQECESVSRTRVRPAFADLRKPRCRLTRAPAKSKRDKFLKAYNVKFRCDETVSVTGRLIIGAKRRRGRVVLSKAGDVTLAEVSRRAGANVVRGVTLKPSKRLRGALPKRFRARLVLEARDEFGNRTVLRRTVKVSTPKKKKKRSRRR